MTHRLSLRSLSAILIASLAMLLPISNAQAQILGEPLLEAPVHQLPEGMTYEDYVDSNLRITTGLARAFIPGSVHAYAGEESASWWIKGAAALGFAAIIAGAATATDTTEFDSAYSLVTLDDGHQYQKIPVARTEGPDGSASSTDYVLSRVPDKTVSEAGSALVGLGAVAIMGSYLYDIFEGMSVIEEKRNRARFKYGKIQPAAQAKVSIQPTVDPVNGGAGVSVGMQF